MKKIVLFMALSCVFMLPAWAQNWDGTSMRGPVAPAPPPNVPGSPYYQGDDNSAPPPPRAVWENRWGAFAYDRTGVVGVSARQKSKSEAIQAAMTDCISNGGVQCTIGAAFGNDCIALVIHPNNILYKEDTLIEQAKKEAMNLCNQDGTTHACKLIYADCSLPVRIR
jgi:hypothetical protein